MTESSTSEPPANCSTTAVANPSAIAPSLGAITLISPGAGGVSGDWGGWGVGELGGVVRPSCSLGEGLFRFGSLVEGLLGVGSTVAGDRLLGTVSGVGILTEDSASTSLPISVVGANDINV
ncbi:MAG: hypothetical protein MUD14_24615 [Hydrococcus sp. Prado102]|nr:hypothetical protein [Hydrococcus sp. Prado102]